MSLPWSGYAIPKASRSLSSMARYPRSAVTVIGSSEIVRRLLSNFPSESSALPSTTTRVSSITSVPDSRSSNLRSAPANSDRRMPVVAASIHIPAKRSVMATCSQAASSSTVQGWGLFLPRRPSLGSRACAAGLNVMYSQPIASPSARCKRPDVTYRLGLQSGVVGLGYAASPVSQYCPLGGVFRCAARSRDLARPWPESTPVRLPRLPVFVHRRVVVPLPAARGQQFPVERVQNGYRELLYLVVADDRHDVGVHVVHVVRIGGRLDGILDGFQPFDKELLDG